MTPVDREADALLSPIRVFQQQGDIHAAASALDHLLHGSVSTHPAFQAIYGVVSMLSGQAQKGQEMIHAIAAIPPRFAAWAGDLGFGLFLTGDNEQALACFEWAAAFPDVDAVFFNRMGSIALASGNVEAAVRAFENAMAMDPNKAEIHSNLGGAMVRLGRLSDALSHYTTALFLTPDLIQAKHGKMSLLLELDRADDAIYDLERELEETTDPHAQKRQTLYLAGLLHGAGRFKEAVTHFHMLIKDHETDTSLHLRLAGLLQDRSLYGQAIAVLKQAETTSPDNPNVISMLAKNYGEIGQHDQALTYMEKMVALAPNAPGTFLSRAYVNFLADNHEEAEKDLRYVTTQFPRMAEAWGLLGHQLMVTGALKEAISCFETASALNPTGFANLIEARAFPNAPQVIEKLTGFAENPLYHPESRIALSFSLCRCFEDMGDHDRAFYFAEMGNRLVMRTHAYDADLYDRLAAQIKETFTPELMRRFRGHGSRSTRPIFIVGMPRSGTTLIEQMLSSHPDVTGAGELGLIPAVTHLMPRVIRTTTPYPACMEMFDPWMADHAARYYLKKLHAMDACAPRVTDKLPHNFLHLGLIYLMFPKAKIIHVNRDMGDVAISNYFTNFKYKNGIMGFAFDLTTIGKMIRIHDDLIAHYAAILPTPFYRISYDDLVENPKPVMKDLCAYLDLSWDDGILDFHHTRRSVKTASVWQVRQPLYRSSKKRWKHYATYLTPLQDMGHGPSD